MVRRYCIIRDTSAHNSDDYNRLKYRRLFTWPVFGGVNGLRRKPIVADIGHCLKIDGSVVASRMQRSTSPGNFKAIIKNKKKKKTRKNEVSVRPNSIMETRVSDKPRDELRDTVLCYWNRYCCFTITEMSPEDRDDIV